MNCIYPNREDEGKRRLREITISLDDVYGTLFANDWDLIVALSIKGSPFKYLVENICRYHAVKEEDFLSSSREGSLAKARWYYGFFSINVIRSLIPSDSAIATNSSVTSPIGRSSELIVHYTRKFLDTFDTNLNFREEVKDFCLTMYDEEFWAETKRSLLKRGVRNLV